MFVSPKVLIVALLLSSCVRREDVVHTVEVVLAPIVPSDGTDAFGPVSVVSVVDAMSGSPLRCKDLSRVAFGDALSISQVPMGRFVLPPQEVRPWSSGNVRVAIPSFRPDYLSNPWSALLIRLDRQAALEDTTHPTILEACTCVRLSTGTHANAALDAEIKSSCPLVGTATRAAIPVELRSPIPDGVHLRDCDEQERVAVLGRENNRFDDPVQLCLDVGTCDATPQENCVRCRGGGQTCVPFNQAHWDLVRFAKQIRSAPTSPTQVTLAPQVDGLTIDLRGLTECTDLVMDTWIPGRSERISTPVACVRPTHSVLTASFELPSDTVTRGVMIPETKRAGVVETPAHLALLMPDASGALRLLEIAVNQGQWAALPSLGVLVPPDERLLSVRSYRRSTAEGAESLIAVATTTTSSLTRPIVRVLRPGSLTAAAQVLSDGPRSCTPEPCGQGCVSQTCLVAPSLASMTDADVNRDGATDLVFGAAGSTTLIQYYGSASSTTGLARSCGCRQLGATIEDGGFELLELGGPSSSPGLDLAIASTGLRVDYGGSANCSGCQSPPAVWRSATQIIGRARLSRPDVDDLIVYDPSSDVVPMGGPVARILFGGPWDFTQFHLQQDPPWRTTTSAFWGSNDPSALGLGDFNGDGAQDLSYGNGSSILLGGHRRDLAVDSPAAQSLTTLDPCRGGEKQLALTGDLDGDGITDIAVLCKPTNLRGTTLEWHRFSRP